MCHSGLAAREVLEEDVAEDVESGLAALSQGQMRHWRSGRIPNVRYSFGGLRLVSARGTGSVGPSPCRLGIRGRRPQGRGLIPARGGLTAQR